MEQMGPMNAEVSHHDHKWAFSDAPLHFGFREPDTFTLSKRGLGNRTVVISPTDMIFLYCRYVTDSFRLEIREGHVVDLGGDLYPS